MASVTRQALTDCIDPVDLMQHNGKDSQKFQETFAWLFLALTQNDVVLLTDATRAQLDVMFRTFPKTRENIAALIAAAGA